MSFYISEINSMNNTYPWNGTIKDINGSCKNGSDKKSSGKYTLHATGDTDLTNGRTYIYLPVNTKITHEVKKKYNLM